MAVQSYSQHRFEKQVQDAMKSVRGILEANRKPQVADKVHHQYVDKFILVDHLVNIAVASQLNGLARVGLSREHLKQMKDWSKDRPVSLKFTNCESTVFLHKEEREMEGSTTHVIDETVTAADGTETTKHVEHKVITKVTEYYWKTEVQYKLSAYRGASSDDSFLIASGVASREFQTTSDQDLAKQLSPAFSDVNITWLLNVLEDDLPYTPCFTIKRQAQCCATPRRNAEVEAAVEYFRMFYTWCQQISRYFDEQYRAFSPSNAGASKKLPYSFVPVLPLLEEAHGSRGSDVLEGAASLLLASLGRGSVDPVSSSSLVLPERDLNSFLVEESRSQDVRCKDLDTAWGGKFLSIQEVSFFVVAEHLMRVIQQLMDGFDFVEDMLRNQLLAAVGQEITPGDFAAYMRFHNRKLFRPEFEPQPFCFPIRRSDNHAPEGLLSIEQRSTEDDSISQPIAAMVNSASGGHPMQFLIGAATRVTFGGSRYLHAICRPQFSSSSGVNFSLESRAHQFSNFIMLVGRIQSATLFEPQYAMIVQNKDEIRIPLELSTIPAPKEFRDAIESLSPEMQAFAKAFRSMQLESTVFGVLVIQIKPQMEKLLGLPEDSLTKEIILMQDLMELFVEYNLSGDLVSFTGDESMSGEAKLAAVKAHVKSMQDVLKQGMQGEIDAFKAKAELELDEVSYSSRGSSAISLYEDGVDFIEDKRGLMPKGSVVSKSRARSNSPPSPGCTRQNSPTRNEANSTEPSRRQSGGDLGGTAGEQLLDYTMIPRELDQRFEDMDEDRALRPTIISAGSTWTKQEKKALLTDAQESRLGPNEQKAEREKAFDLLDSLTKSGALSIDAASLHVVLAATHHFDKDVVETVIQNNTNPIEKVERSTLLMASTIHRQPAAAIVKASEVPRLRGITPALFDN